MFQFVTWKSCPHKVKCPSLHVVFTAPPTPTKYKMPHSVLFSHGDLITSQLLCACHFLCHCLSDFTLCVPMCVCGVHVGRVSL